MVMEGSILQRRMLDPVYIVWQLSHSIERKLLLEMMLGMSWIFCALYLDDLEDMQLQFAEAMVTDILRLYSSPHLQGG